MVEFLPRSAWTDTTPGFRNFLAPSKVRFLALHYPADSGLPVAPTRENVSARLRAYRRYHVAPKPTGRGWPDIGYCFAVDQMGRVWEAAGERVAAHSATPTYPLANHEGVGVLLVLGNRESPSTAMVEAVRVLRAKLLGKYAGMHTLWPHSGVPGASTACPGDATRALISKGDFTRLPLTTTTPEDDMPTPQELIDALAAARYVTPSTAPRSIFDALNHLISLTDTALLEQRAQTVALTAAVQALSGAVGVDPAQVQATVREAVDAALAGLRISREA